MGAGLGLVLPIGTAHAQNVRLGSKTLDELGTCKAITTDAARLACFDRVSERILAARASGDLLALDRQKVVENKRRAFGLGGQTDKPLGGGSVDREIAVTKVDTKVSGVSQFGYGRYRLALANDTVWETIDPVAFEPRTGADITIRRAPLGGFRAMIDGGRSILIKRVR
ncbi:hypothetical protein EAH84_11955 [Sphingomonas oligophenolica]|uniref:Uncharacterized protein n=1 Tax=Sphingomonas oligophenolica TaxID=301154 RepID=A0A502CDU6_9SPHN|nr:hypothetical protein EAH84_11955 [Sphingomonas oligophenolica]